MKIRAFFTVALLIFLSTSIFAHQGDKKNKKAADSLSYIEANVLVGQGNCGYLLQLANGDILKPTTTLHKKFHDNHLKVLVKYQDKNEYIQDTECHAIKEITIIEIKKYKATGHVKAKY